MQPELAAAIQGILDISVDIKKGLKSGGVVAALLADADLMAKLEIVASKLSAIPADVKALSLADVGALLQIVVPGVEALIAA